MHMDAKRLVAHRGDNTHYPENSYAGIESALRAGALFIEFDIQMNADQSLIVFHDDSFKRTTNKNGSIFESDDVTIKAISAHEPRRFGEQHYPTHIPHLSEILNLLSNFPKAHAFVEIKVQSLKYWGVKTVMDKLLNALKKHQAQTTIISFSTEALQYTKEHSQLQTGFVFLNYNNKTEQHAKKLNPTYLICSHLIIPEKNLWKGDWLWMVYSLNHVKQMQKAFKRKDIELFETDDIRRMLEA